MEYFFFGILDLLIIILASAGVTWVVYKIVTDIMGDFNGRHRN